MLAMSVSWLLLISIHALREEGDQQGKPEKGAGEKFLSTPSVRRATPGQFTVAVIHTFLSTPSVRRATPPHHSF